MQLQSASGSRKRGSQRGKWWKGTSGRHRQQESFLSSRGWTSFHSNYEQQRQWLCCFVLTILVYMNKKLKISTSCLWLTQLLSLSTKPPCSLSWIFKTHTTSFPSSRVTNGRQLLTPRSDILSISKVSSNSVPFSSQGLSSTEHIYDAGERELQAMKRVLDECCC